MFTELDWAGALDLGVDDLDRQHQHILGLATGVDSAIRRGAGTAEIGFAVDRLHIAFIEHFSHEEAMMLDTGIGMHISQIEAHMVSHKALLLRLEAIRRILGEGGDLLAGWADMDVAAGLVEEIVRHDGPLVTALARVGRLRAPVNDWSECRPAP